MKVEDAPKDMPFDSMNLRVIFFQEQLECNMHFRWFYNQTENIHLQIWSIISN